MNSHELAAKLLDMPDVPVRVHASARGWEDDLDIEPEDVTVETEPDGSQWIKVWPA